MSTEPISQSLQDKKTDLINQMRRTNMDDYAQQLKESKGEKVKSKINLRVRRNHVLMDSFRGTHERTSQEFKRCKLSVTFYSEQEVPTQEILYEWFKLMFKDVFNPEYVLFAPLLADNDNFHPNPLSDMNPEHLIFFTFIGRMIGKAIVEGYAMQQTLSKAVRSYILGKPVSLEDMKAFDPARYELLTGLLSTELTEPTGDIFSVEYDRFGAIQTVDLIEGGRNVAVTEENKVMYVDLIVRHYLIDSVGTQLDHLASGFFDVVPRELIQGFDGEEFGWILEGPHDNRN